MDSLKKYIAEFFGTFTLVLVGCGTAMTVGCDAESGCGYILTAFAFGLVIVGMAYCIGNVSGCHINPAVSLACLLSKRMSGKDFLFYCVSQVLGALAGAAVLRCIWSLGDAKDLTNDNLGANGLPGFSGDWAWAAGLIVDVSCIFPHLQNPESGKFDFSGLASVNWMVVIIATVVAALIAAIAFGIIYIKKNKQAKEA